MTNLSDEQLAQALKNPSVSVGESYRKALASPTVSQRHKYNAIPTIYNSVRYSSKKEAKYAAYLDDLIDRGDVLYWLRQIPFTLPGNTRYVADFLVFYADGTHKFIDVKGVQTPAFKKNKKQVEALYKNVKIEVV